MSEQFNFGNAAPPRRRPQGLSAATVVLSMMAVLMVMAGIGGAFGYMHYQSRQESNLTTLMLDDQVRWTILSNRESAIAQQVSWWTRINGPDIHELEAEETSAKRAFDAHDAGMHDRWRSQFKRLGQLSPDKAMQAARLSDRTRAEVAQILRRCDTELEQEYTIAKARMQADVHNSMPLSPAQIFDTTTTSGKIKQQEQSIRLAAQDDLVRAQRATAVAERSRTLYQEISGKWVDKAHHDIKAKLATLEAEFLRK